MSRRHEYKNANGAEKATQARADRSQRDVADKRSIKLTRTRLVSDTRTFPDLLAMWDVQQFCAGSEAQVQTLCYLLYAAADVADLERVALSPEHAALLVRYLQHESTHLHALGAITSLLYFSCERTPLYAQALCASGLVDALSHLADHQSPDARRALWETVYNLACAAPEAACQLMHSPLYGSRLPMAAAHDSALLPVVTNAAAGVLQEVCLAREPVPQERMYMLWGLLSHVADAAVQKPNKWRNDLSEGAQILVTALAAASRMLVCVACTPDDRHALLCRDDVPAPSLVRVLLHFAALQDAPVPVRRACAMTLCDLATMSEPAWYTDLLLQEHSLWCLTALATSSHDVLRALAMQWIGNLAAGGSDAVQLLHNCGITALMRETILQGSSRSRVAAVFALGAAVRACQREYAHSMKKSDQADRLLKELILVQDALRGLAVLLDPTYGSQAVCDTLEVIEAAVDWQRDAVVRRLEKYELDTYISKLAVTGTRSVSTAAMRLEDKINNRSPDAREMEYMRAAKTLPVHAGQFSF